MTGLLLAGGRSTRMGRDKLSLDFEGRPLAARPADVLRRIADEVLVASGDGRRLDWLGLPQVPDAVPDAGPLGGLVAGLECASHELVAVLAADMPFASADVLLLLARAWKGEDAVVSRTERGIEPLHAVYAKTAAPRLRAALVHGSRAMHEVLPLLRTREIHEPEWQVADPSARFACNVNRPQDLP